MPLRGKSPFIIGGKPRGLTSKKRITFDLPLSRGKMVTLLKAGL
jgi:hypothetical protein